MGYRSEVRIATTEEGYGEFLKACDAKNAALGVERPLIGTGIEPDSCERERGCVLFGWDEVKWYDLYADVQAVEQAIAEMDERDIPCRFVRVGEDWDDIEVMGDIDGLAVFPTPETFIDVCYA